METTIDARAAWNAAERLATVDMDLARSLVEVLRESRVSAALQALAEEHDHTGGECLARQAAEQAVSNDPFVQMGGTCPKCGAMLSRCSPSGNGRAACDPCQTWWE